MDRAKQGPYCHDQGPIFPSTAQASSVSKLFIIWHSVSDSKIHFWLDRFHGNGPYCKILTEKEPIRAQGFA